MKKLLLQYFAQQDPEQTGLLFIKTVQRALCDDLPRIIRMGTGEVEMLLGVLDVGSTGRVEYKHMMQVMEDYKMIPDLSLVPPVFRQPDKRPPRGDGSRSGSRQNRVRSASQQHNRAVSRDSSRTSYQEAATGKLFAPKQIHQGQRLDPLGSAPLFPIDAFPSGTGSPMASRLPPASPVHPSGHHENGVHQTAMPPNMLSSTNSSSMASTMPAGGVAMYGGGWLSPLRPHSSGGQPAGEHSSSQQQLAAHMSASVQSYMPNLSHAMAHEVSEVSNGTIRPPRRPAPEQLQHVPFWGIDMLGQAHKAEFATKLASATSAAHEAAFPTSEVGGALRNTRFVPNGSTISMNLKSELESQASIDALETSSTGFPLTALERSRQLSRGSQNIAGFSNSKGLLFGKTRAEAFLTHLRTGVDTLSRSIRRNLKDFAESDSDDESLVTPAHARLEPTTLLSSTPPQADETTASILHDSASNALLQRHAAAVANALHAEPQVQFVDLDPEKQAAMKKIAQITEGFERSYKTIAFVVWAEEAVRRQRQEQREFIARCRATDKFRKVFVKLWHRSVGPRFISWKREAWGNIETLRHIAAKSIQSMVRVNLAQGKVQLMREQRAALRIQSAARMSLVQKQYPSRLQNHKELEATVNIQRVARGAMLRIRTKRSTEALRRQQAANKIQALFRGRKARRKVTVMRAMSTEIMETQQAIRSAHQQAKAQAALAATAKAELEMLVSLTRDRRKAELRAKAEAEKTVALEKAKRGQERMTREALRAAEKVAAQRFKTEASEQKIAAEAEAAAIEARDSAVALLAHRKRAEVRHVAALRIQNTFRSKQQRDLERLQSEIAAGVSDNAALKRTMTAMKKTDEVARDTMRKMVDIEKAVLVAGEFIKNAVRSVEEEAVQAAAEAAARREAADARLASGGSPRRRSLSPKRSQSPKRRDSLTSGSLVQDTKSDESKAEEVNSGFGVPASMEQRPSAEIANEKRALIAKAQSIETGQGAIEQLQATIRSLQAALKKERTATQQQIAALEAKRVNGAREVERAILETLADPMGMSKKLEDQTRGKEHFRKYQSALTCEFRKRRRRQKRFGSRMLRFRKQVQPWDYKFSASADEKTPSQPKWIKFYEPAADALYFFNTATMERRWTKPTHADGYSTSDTEASDDDVQNAPWAVGGASTKKSDQLRAKALVESMDPAVVAAQNARWKAYACAECAANKCTRRCDQCGESYCDRCHAMLHKRGRRSFHTWKAVRPWLAVEHAGHVHRKDACSDCHAAPSTRKCLQCAKEYCGTCFELTHRTDVMKNMHSWTLTEHGRKVKEEKDRKNGKNETVFATAAHAAAQPAYDDMSYIAEEAAEGLDQGGEGEQSGGDVQYDADGGCYDEYGGYIDAEGGYTDAEGNYTSPDGVYYEAAVGQ